VSATASAYLGWLATATFAVSYFFRRPAATRAVQMFGATLWIFYGGLIASTPVVVANSLVLAAAAWAAVRRGLPAAAPAHEIPLARTPAVRRD
jgi:hypothetical protein